MKYEFLKYKNNETKKLKSGKFFTVQMKSNDTLHTYSGTFIKLESDSLFIELDYERYSYETDELGEIYKLDRSFEDKLLAIHKSEIEKIIYSTFYYEACAAIAGTGFAGLILGPLVGVDGEADEGFNTKRYKQTLKYSAIALAGGTLLSFKGPLELKIP